MPHRKRLRRWERREARSLTISCYHRQPLFDDAVCCERYVEALRCARGRCGFLLIAWVVMPEHVHLLIVPTNRWWPVPRILRLVHQPVAQQTISAWKRDTDPRLPSITLPDGSHRFWQAGGGFDRNVRDGRELTNAIAYIHRNPVARGLVEREIDWRWSSARWYAGQREGQIPIDPIPR